MAVRALSGSCGVRHVALNRSRAFHATGAHQHVELVTAVPAGAGSVDLQLGVTGVGSASIVALATDLVEVDELGRCCRRGNLRGVRIKRRMAKLSFGSLPGQVVGTGRLVRVVACRTVSDVRNIFRRFMREVDDLLIGHRADVDALFGRFRSEEAAVALDAAATSTVCSRT